MSGSAMTIVPASEASIPEILELIMAQQARQLVCDPHLAPGGSRALVERSLREHIHSDALVALNDEGRVRGYAQPAVWTLKTTSILLSFLTARNGIIQKLTLPDTADEDAVVVTSSLLTALDQFWTSGWVVLCATIRSALSIFQAWQLLTFAWKIAEEVPIKKSDIDCQTRGNLLE